MWYMCIVDYTYVRWSIYEIYYGVHIYRALGRMFGIEKTHQVYV